MQIKSEAQRKWLAENKPEVLKKMEAETPKDQKLPERLGSPKAKDFKSVLWR